MFISLMWYFTMTWGVGLKSDWLGTAWRHGVITWAGMSSTMTWTAITSVTSWTSRDRNWTFVHLSWNVFWPWPGTAMKPWKWCGNGTTGGDSATGVAGGSCVTLGWGLLDLSLVFSINACMPDSTVWRICWIISSGLKVMLGPCWTGWDGVGAGGVWTTELESELVTELETVGSSYHLHKLTKLCCRLRWSKGRRWPAKVPHVLRKVWPTTRKHGQIWQVWQHCQTITIMVKITNIWCIHNSCSIRDKAQGPRLSSHNPLDSWRVQPLKLRAQFQPHQSNQKEETTPVKHVLLPVHVKWLRAVSWSNREVVVVASQLWRVSEKEEGPVQRPVVQHTLPDRHVKQWKKASCSLYLNELLIQKCKFRHRFTVNC